MLVFDQLQRIAKPVMRAFTSDLVHDAKWIEANPGEPFIHVTRETGTHIIPFPDPADLAEDALQPFLFSEARPSEICRQMVELMQGTLRESGKVWLYCDGKRLHRWSQERCVGVYQRKLRCAKRQIRRERSTRASNPATTPN